MNENQENQKDLIDTTDCLEAIGVFRGWKNALFIITLLCLLLLQVSFWLVNTGWVKTEGKTKTCPSAVTAEESEKTTEAVKQVVPLPDKIEQAAKQVAEANLPAEAAPKQRKTIPFFFNITSEWLTRAVRFINFVLILSATLYCLTMLFSLKVSLLGRLGGINHISRAFFLSLVMLVLILPWQKFLLFANVICGAIYAPEELLSSCAGTETRSIFGEALHYWRFTGLWLLVLLLLIWSQVRSARWSRAILRRLEVI
jgi:hypothetical protein